MQRFEVNAQLMSNGNRCPMDLAALGVHKVIRGSEVV